MTEFLRLSGIYWGVTALDLMENVDKIDQDEIVEYIKKCQCPVSGGISPCEGHDPHILYTLSAVQVTYSFVIEAIFLAKPSVLSERTGKLKGYNMHTKNSLYRFFAFTIAWKKLMWKRWPDM